MEEETKRKGPTSPAIELAKLVNEIGIHDVAREVGYTTGAIHKMIRENTTRPVVENWARLYRAQATPEAEMELVVCRVPKDSAKQLQAFVALVIGGRALRFTDQ